MAYGRIVEVTIGPGGKAPSFVSGLSPASATASPGKSGQGQVIRDLHMNFKVKKSLGRGAAIPTAELKIYNMSLKSYFSFVKINYGLMIAVGYKDEASGAQQQSISSGAMAQAAQTVGIPLMLFSGSIRFCRRYREKADWIVYIEADGGMWNIGGAPYSVSMQPGIDTYSMLANLSSSMKVPIRNLSTVQGQFNKVYSSGFSFIGNVRDFVFALCDAIGFIATIDEGEIILIPPASVPSGLSPASSSQTPSTTSGLLISKDTGLLQSPEPEQISIGVPDSTAAAEGGSQSLPEMRWKIDALLLPQVGPGDVMQVKSQNLAGGSAYMMVEEIEYDGDNRKDDFKMEARCIPVDSNGNPLSLQQAQQQVA